jgi:hypothetical protein
MAASLILLAIVLGSKLFTGATKRPNFFSIFDFLIRYKIYRTWAAHVKTFFLPLDHRGYEIMSSPAPRPDRSFADPSGNCFGVKIIYRCEHTSQFFFAFFLFSFVFGSFLLVILFFFFSPFQFLLILLFLSFSSYLFLFFSLVLFFVFLHFSSYILNC